MDIHLVFWIGFAVLFIAVFSIDMVVSDRRRGEIRVKTASSWTLAWVATAFLFAGAIYSFYPGGDHKAFEFITGYIIEYSLSVDNLFVFILIFSLMGVCKKNQLRILKWGILGAVFFRIVFILAGVGLIQKFHFMLYLFGGILVVTAYKMLTSDEEQIEPENNLLVKLARKMFNIKTEATKDRFFVKENGQTFATMGFITLVLIESTDIIFAVDSIPAVLSVTQDSFIAITSNLFAIIGLRSLFFALSGILNLFRYLKYGISMILLFIGLKMLVSGWVHVSIQASLLVIVAILTSSILASVIIKGKEPELAKIDQE